jgi:hypothetical protein
VSKVSNPGDGVLLIGGYNYTCSASSGTAQCYLPSPKCLNTWTANTSTGTGTVTFCGSTPSWFVNGHAVTLGSGVISYNGTLPYPLQPGPAGTTTDAVYYLANISGSTFQLQDYTHTLISSFSSAGTGTFYIQQWPSPSTGATPNVIDVTSAASALPSPGVGLNDTNTPQYQGAFANLVFTQGSGPGGACQGTGGAYYGCSHFEAAPFAQGWVIRHVNLQTPASGNAIDPVGRPQLIAMNLLGGDGQSPENTVFDQCLFSEPPPPDRIAIFGIDLGGANVAIQNSWFENFENWYPNKNSTLSGSGSTLTLSAGANYWWNHNLTVASPLTATVSGTGALNAYWDASGNPTLAPGTGVTVSGATGWTVLATGSVTAGRFPQATDTQGNSRWAVYPMGFATVTSGTLAVTDQNAVSCATQTNNVYGPAECPVTAGGDAQGIQMGYPGPYSFINNLFDWTGIAGPFWDSIASNACDTQFNTVICPPIPWQAHDVVVQRNNFRLGGKNGIWVKPLATPLASWTYTPTGVRNSWEWKAGQRILVTGNKYQGGAGDVGASGGCGGPIANEQPLISPAVYETVETDVDISYETTYNCTSYGGVFSYYQGGGQQFPNPPPTRVHYHNNLISSFDRSPLTLTMTTNPPYGQAYAIGGVVQDYIGEHNTFIGRAGYLPLLSFWQGSLPTGLVVQNNLFDFTASTGTTSFADFQFQNIGDINPVTFVPSVPAGLAGSSLVSALPVATFASNVAVPTWTTFDPTTPTSWTCSQIGSYSSAWSSSQIAFATTGACGYAANIGTVGWFNPQYPLSSGGDYRLKYSSPYISGSHFANDGLDIGADMDALASARGDVSGVHAFSSTSTATTIGFLAPDSYGCAVDWGTTAFWTGSGTWTRVANAGGQRVQNVSLTGLPAHGLVYVEVECAVQQPQFTVQLP